MNKFFMMLTTCFFACSTLGGMSPLMAQSGEECFSIKIPWGLSWEEIIEREGEPSIAWGDATDGSLTFPVNVFGREGKVSYLFDQRHDFTMYSFDFTYQGEEAKKQFFNQLAAGLDCFFRTPGRDQNYQGPDRQVRWRVWQNDDTYLILAGDSLAPGVEIELRNKKSQRQITMIEKYEKNYQRLPENLIKTPEGKAAQ